MKTREETQISIRRKSMAKLAERARRRRAALSAAACVALVIGAAGVWQLRGSSASESDSLTMDAAPLEGEYFGNTTENGYEAEPERDLLTRESERINDIYSAYNATYAAPDSMRIYTLPNADDSREISLSAKNADEQELITQMSDWISALNVTQTRGAVDDSAATYVVERHYGGNVAIVYVQGSRVRFEGGEWLDFSEADEKEFQEMIQKMFG